MSDRSVADLLAGVPLLSALSAADRTRLAAVTRSRMVPAGEWLFRRAEPGDRLYLVVSGRVEIVDDDGAVVRALGPGSTVGELALLGGEVRSASARVRRDAQLLELGREEFERLLESTPGFATALLAHLARLLRVSRATPAAGAARAGLVALTGDPTRVPLHRFAREVARAAGGVAVLDAGVPGLRDAASVPALGALVDRHEADRSPVLLLAEQPSGTAPEWDAFCLRQADRVVLLLDGDGDAAAPGEVAGRDVVLVGAGARDRVEAVAAAGPRTLHVCDDAGLDTAAARIGRRITGRALGLVLSGGGARALAHVGVLDELTARGLAVDRVAACSMGAIVGGLYAAGGTPEGIAQDCRREFVARNPLSDYTVPLVALTRGRRARRTLERLFGAVRIEALPREFVCVSCDLVGAETVVHRRGPLATAVGAGASLPGVVPPWRVGGRLLVDGGLLDNLPVGHLADGDGPVLAVDVAAPFRWDGRAVPGRAAAVRAGVVGQDGALPGIAEVLTRVITLGGADAVVRNRARADVVVTPDVAAIGLTAWDRLDDARAAGREAARRALDAAAIAVESR